MLCPIHTADADATQLSSWVASASAVCIGHNTRNDASTLLRKARGIATKIVLADKLTTLLQSDQWRPDGLRKSDRLEPKPSHCSGSVLLLPRGAIRTMRVCLLAAWFVRSFFRPSGVQHLCQTSLLTSERSRSKFKLKIAKKIATAGIRGLRYLHKI